MARRIAVTEGVGQRFVVLISSELFEKFRFGQTGKRLAIRKAAAEGEHVLPGVFDDGGEARCVKLGGVCVAADALQRAGDERGEGQLCVDYIIIFTQ